MQLLWCLLLFLTLSQGAIIQCPQQQWYNAGCNASTIVLLDASDRLDLMRQKQYMDFVWNSLLTHWAYPAGQQLSFTSYGVPEPQQNPFVTTFYNACMQLDDVRANMYQYGGLGVSLSQALQQLKQNYQAALQKPQTNILLLSGASDQAEIDSAATFVSTNFPNVPMTVVGFCDDLQACQRAWKNFPAFNFITDTTLLIQGNTMFQNEILCNACGSCPNGAGKWTDGTGTPLPLPPTTPLPMLTTAAPAPGTDGPTCGKTHTRLWLDIMFLLDSSSGDGYDGLEDMLWLINHNTGAVYIEKSGQSVGTQYNTRIGLATYSNKTTLYGKLYGMDKSDLIYLKLYADPVANTNLDDAIKVASAQFDDPKAHRPNAKKVIVVMGHDYEPGNYPLPTDAANAFKQNGGIIIVYDYVGQDDVLQSIASPGFYLRTNCFCPTGTASFTTIPGTSIPASGCYFKKYPANNQAASNQCKQNNTGVISQNKNSIKTTFLQSQDKGNTIWSGATLDSFSGTWVWVNGQKVDMSTVTWLNAPQQGQGCAALATDGKWIATDCRNTYDFVCEIAPCDSNHYCN